MVSGGHIWEERISTNPLLTHYLVRGTGDAMFGPETERKWSFQGTKKNYKRKTCFTKCSLWKIFQLNVKIKQNQ